MIQNNLILFGFVVFSLAGWVIEIIYRSVHAGRFVNPGAFRGPYLPIYGIGALLLMGCIYLIGDWNIMVKIPVYLLVTTGLEFVAGFILQNCFSKQLWDYSNQLLNYRGYICLKFSICWVLLALLFECCIFPSFLRMTQHLSFGFMFVAGLVGMACMLVEFIIGMRRIF